MKVLLTLASASVTGPAERVMGDARALLAAGHEVSVAHDTVRPGNFGERLMAAGIPREAGLALCPKPTPAQLARDLFRLRAALRAGRFDLVHAHFSHDHQLAILAALGLRRRPRIVRAAETERQLEPTIARRQSYRRSDGLEVATRERAARLVQRFGLAPERVEALAGAVDAERFRPAPPGAPSPLRQRLGIGAEVPLVGIVARIKAERRHTELLAAFARLAPDFPAARLAIVGRGEGEPALRAEALRLGIERRVHFAGYWAGPELVQAYQGLDVAVWLAEGNDGSCRGVLEAMAVGLPMVAGDAGASAELVQGGASGLLVPPGDVPALTVALGRLLAAPGERRAFGDAGRRRAQEHYSWERRGEALVDFYARLEALPAVS